MIACAVVLGDNGAARLPSGRCRCRAARFYGARSIRAIHLEALVGTAKCRNIVDDVLAVGVTHVDPEGEVRTGLLPFFQLIERR